MRKSDFSDHISNVHRENYKHPSSISITVVGMDVRLQNLKYLRPKDQSCIKSHMLYGNAEKYRKLYPKMFNNAVEIGKKTKKITYHFDEHVYRKTKRYLAEMRLLNSMPMDQK